MRDRCQRSLRSRMNNLRRPIPTAEQIQELTNLIKRLLKCKCFALIFCVAGTAVLLLLPLDFLDSKILAIVLPSFLSGYIIVNVAGIFTAYRGHVDLVADILFSSSGGLVNTCCGLYLLYYWIDWVISTFESGKGTEGITFLILSATCLLDVAAMVFEFIVSILEKAHRAIHGRTTVDETTDNN